MALGDKLFVVMGKEKAVPSGVATLDENGILAEAQRPSAAEILTLNGKSVEEALKSAGLPTGGLEGQALVKAGADSETPTKWGPWPSNLNLLINGDFRKPVNRNGKREYTGAGFTLDGWKNSLSNMVTLNDEFITISRLQTDNGYENFQQTRPGKLYNKETVTVSIMYRNVKSSEIALYNISQNQWLNSVILSTSNDWNVLSFTTTIGENVFSITDLLGIMIYPGMAGQQVTNSLDIKAVKLELGSVQTLAHKDADGNWVLNDPPNYDLQYALCSQYSPITGEFVGSQHSNLNLLDNPDFAIWQRYPTGAYEGVPSNTFIPDRYQFIAASNVSTTLKRIDGGGICCESGSRCQILYKDENATTYAGKTMTLSCLSSKGLQTDTKIMPTNLSAETNLFGLFEHYLTWIYPEETKYRYKLELGPVQTLAHKDENGNWILNDPPPSPSLELLKCQRYFQVFETQSARPTKALDFRPTMRTEPALSTITVAGKTLYTASADS